MVSVLEVKEMMKQMEDVQESPHFDKLSFRVNKKIALTLNEKEQRCTVKFTEVQQSVYSTINIDMIYPVANKWGKQGWTNVDLTLIDAELLQEIIAISCDNCRVK